jgi:hypothetical protein
MEAYHHIATHSETFEPAYHARDSKTPDTDGPWSILHMPAASDEMPDPTSHGPTGALEDWQVRDLFANVAFPHFLFGLQGLSLVWYQVLPQSVDRLLLKIHICLPKSELAKPGADEIVQGTAEMMDFIHREDIGAHDPTRPLVAAGKIHLAIQSMVVGRDGPGWHLMQNGGAFLLRRFYSHMFSSRAYQRSYFCNSARPTTMWWTSSGPSAKRK